MRKRPMCTACLGFMLVLVLLRIAGVPLGTPFSDPKYENKAQQGRKRGLQGQLKRMRKRAATTGMCCAGRSKGKFICSQSGEICQSEPLCGCTEL